MSELFDDREKGFEAKFKLDQEIKFKIDARRNKLLGLWLAEKLGLTESKHEEYANEIILADLQEPGFEDVIRKALSDVHEHGAKVTETDIREKLHEFEKVAIGELLKK